MALLLGPPPARAQACKDETTMVENSKQTLMEFTEKVRKESLADFENSDHQKSAASRLSLHAGMVGELVSCLEKASQDSTLSKEDAAAAKTQYDATLKLQEKLKQEQAAIKDAKTPKDAKALVEKLDLAP